MSDALRGAAEQAVVMMEKAKRLLKAAGLVMEGGTISAPYNEALEALRTALSAPAAAAAGAVPVGWKLVPEVPTQEMCQQGQWKAKEWPRFPLRISPIYQSMIAAAPPAPVALSDRTPAEYAIEHAEYMAKDAERLLEALQEHASALMALEEDYDPDTDQDITAMTERAERAKELLGEYMTHMRSSVYEFRKRRDRALAAQKGGGT